MTYFISKPFLFHSQSLSSSFFHCFFRFYSLFLLLFISSLLFAVSLPVLLPVFIVSFISYSSFHFTRNHSLPLLFFIVSLILLTLLLLFISSSFFSVSLPLFPIFHCLFYFLFFFASISLAITLFLLSSSSSYFAPFLSFYALFHLLSFFSTLFIFFFSSFILFVINFCYCLNRNHSCPPSLPVLSFFHCFFYFLFIFALFHSQSFFFRLSSSSYFSSFIFAHFLLPFISFSSRLCLLLSLFPSSFPLPFFRFSTSQRPRCFAVSLLFISLLAFLHILSRCVCSFLFFLFHPPPTSLNSIFIFFFRQSVSFQAFPFTVLSHVSLPSSAPHPFPRLSLLVRLHFT